MNIFDIKTNFVQKLWINNKFKTTKNYYNAEITENL